MRAIATRDDAVLWLAIAHNLVTIQRFRGVAGGVRGGGAGQQPADPSIKSLFPRSSAPMAAPRLMIALHSDAWAADARGDATIIAAMRSASSMSIQTRDAQGRAFADAYALRGAATAIDAAALGCARLR